MNSLYFIPQLIIILLVCIHILIGDIISPKLLSRDNFGLVAQTVSKSWIPFIDKLPAMSFRHLKQTGCPIQNCLDILVRYIERRHPSYNQCKDVENGKRIIIIKLCSLSRETNPSTHFTLEIKEYWIEFDFSGNKVTKMNATFLILNMSFARRVDMLRINKSDVLVKHLSKGYSKKILELPDFHLVEYFNIFEYKSHRKHWGRNSSFTSLHGCHAAHSRFLLFDFTVFRWRLMRHSHSSIVILYQIIDHKLIKDFMIRETVKFKKKPIKYGHG